MTGEYTLGEKTGLWRYWYENGNKKAEIGKDDLCIIWDSDKQLKFHGTYEEFIGKAAVLEKVNDEIKALVSEYVD